MQLFRKLTFTVVWALVFYLGTRLLYPLMMLVDAYVFVSPDYNVTPVLVAVRWMLPVDAAFAAWLAVILGLAGVLPWTDLNRGDEPSRPRWRQPVALVMAVAAVIGFCYLSIGPLHAFLTKYFMLDPWVRGYNESIPEDQRGTLTVRRTGKSVLYQYQVSLDQGDPQTPGDPAHVDRLTTAALRELAISGAIAWHTSRHVPLRLVIMSRDGRELARRDLAPTDLPGAAPEIPDQD